MTDSIRFLGMAKKAGMIVTGEESCGAAVKAHKARLLMTCSDSSGNAQKRAGDYAAYGGVPLIALDCTKAELAQALGAGLPSMAALTDAGMAACFLKKLCGESPGRYEEAEEALSARAERVHRRKKETETREREGTQGKRRKNV